mgnify:CR=1 FL=1
MRMRTASPTRPITASSSGEQITASIKENAENARVTEGIAIQASTQGKEGGSAVANTVDAMRNIAQKIAIMRPA